MSYLKQKKYMNKTGCECDSTLNISLRLRENNTLNSNFVLCQ